jgi:hypothetical protein
MATVEFSNHYGECKTCASQRGIMKFCMLIFSKDKQVSLITLLRMKPKKNSKS